LIWLILLGAGIAVFAGLWLLPHLSRVAEQSQALELLEREGQQLSQQVEELTHELNDLLSAPEEKRETADPRISDAMNQARQEQAKRLEEIRLLADTQNKLDDAILTIDELEARIEELSTSVTRLEDEKKLLADSEADLRESLSNSNRVVEAMRAELKGNSDRLVKLEVRNRSLRQGNRDAENKAQAAQKLTRELENLYRRRDDLLTNIVRRYREIADQYRSGALQINNPDQFGPAQGVDLSRIQNALSLAEEDLNQLDALNSRAARLQRQLSE